MVEEAYGWWKETGLITFEEVSTRLLCTGGGDLSVLYVHIFVNLSTYKLTTLDSTTLIICYIITLIMESIPYPTRSVFRFKSTHSSTYRKYFIFQY